MNWVTALRAMLIGRCVAMALPNFMIGTSQERAGPSNVGFDLRTVVTGVLVSVGYYLGAKLGFALTTEGMFEQFFTTKTEGLGMGLAIVRSIVESHGGKIEAENVEGGGARLSFILPASR